MNFSKQPLMKIARNFGFILIPIVFAAVILFFQIRKGRNTEDIVIESPVDSSIISAEKVRMLYEIPIDSFYIEQHKVKKDQNLAEILKQYNLPEGSLNRVLLNPGKVFDARKMREGNSYTVFLSQDTLYQVQYFVYEQTPVDYILFDFTDSLKITAKHKKVNLVERKVTGKINTSLWNAVIDNHIDPMVAIELSEIYAWTIDFFGLQEGDSFKVVYYEKYVDTTSAGIEKIYAAYFRHDGNDFWAIPFVQDSTVSFYDMEGNSLRKAFLKAPLRFSRISSKFSYSRMHPILKIRRPHFGVDYAAPVGTPVHAIGDGKVIKTSFEKGAGRMVKIKHNSVYSTSYLHLSRYGKGIRTGVYVKQGDIIGYVGSSGLSTGPHLDFRFYKNGSPVDPLKVEAPPVEPVSEGNRVAYDSVKTLVLEKLKSF